MRRRRPSPSGLAPRVARMALETSPEHPAPVRQITQAIGQWIDRLGAVWVEGQVTQISRRGGMNTVFLTLRDKLADISVQVTCNRGVIDSLPTPAGRGRPGRLPRQAVVLPQPRHALAQRARDPAGRRGRAAGPARAPPPAAGRRGAVRRGAASGRCRSCPRNVGLVTAQSSAAERDVLENGRRRWPGVRFTVRYAAMQGMHAAREVIEAVQRARPRPRGRRDRGRPRRRLGRGPAAVLRRGA